MRGSTRRAAPPDLAAVVMMGKDLGLAPHHHHGLAVEREASEECGPAWSFKTSQRRVPATDEERCDGKAFSLAQVTDVFGAVRRHGLPDAPPIPISSLINPLARYLRASPTGHLKCICTLNIKNLI